VLQAEGNGLHLELFVETDTMHAIGGDGLHEEFRLESGQLVSRGGVCLTDAWSDADFAAVEAAIRLVKEVAK
jgi:hypothetical protein